MHDFNLHAPEGANKRKRIVGRGQGSGRGRSGGKTYVGFEGGQMPLYRRLAHRGFSNYPFKKVYEVINLGDIQNHYNDGETVNNVSLIEKGLVKKAALIKVLSDGEFTKKLNFSVDAVSAAAKDKIEKAGGTVVVSAKK